MSFVWSCPFKQYHFARKAKQITYLCFLSRKLLFAPKMVFCSRKQFSFQSDVIWKRLLSKETTSRKWSLLKASFSLVESGFLQMSRSKVTVIFVRKLPWFNFLAKVTVSDPKNEKKKKDFWKKSDKKPRKITTKHCFVWSYPTIN